MPQAKKAYKNMVGATQGIVTVKADKSTEIVPKDTLLSEYTRMGVYDYNDLATQTTPINVPGTDTFVELTNDEQGSFTNKTYGLSDVSDVWDSTTNRFDFTGLSLGDTVDIRLDAQVTTTGANQDIDIVLEMATGTGNAYQIPFINTSLKTAKAHDLNRFNFVYMGDTATLNNSAVFKIKSDNAATVKVNGWACKVTKRTS